MELRLGTQLELARAKGVRHDATDGLGADIARSSTSASSRPFQRTAVKRLRHGLLPFGGHVEHGWESARAGFTLRAA